MKLLLDENLSRRIVPAIQDCFPDSTQIALLNLNEADDRQIWEYAKQENYTIVTQDADFHEQSMLVGGPPLIVWLRCGNQPKNVILDKLIKQQKLIEETYQDPKIWTIEIF
ncbi:MAG: putative nuclease of putative toxin-antitoxin system [Polaribacter sp.]|jgi:predicted nuclease of predicted toxin-antitoxin system